MNNNNKLPMVIIISVLGLVSYVGYSIYNASNVVANGSEVLKDRAIGSAIDKIEKGGISFNLSVIEYFSNNTDFTKTVSPSLNIGRDNPFTP